MSSTSGKVILRLKYSKEQNAMMDQTISNYDTRAKRMLKAMNIQKMLKRFQQSEFTKISVKQMMGIDDTSTNNQQIQGSSISQSVSQQQTLGGGQFQKSENLDYWIRRAAAQVIQKREERERKMILSDKSYKDLHQQESVVKVQLKKEKQNQSKEIPFISNFDQGGGGREIVRLFSDNQLLDKGNNIFLTASKRETETFVTFQEPILNSPKLQDKQESISSQDNLPISNHKQKGISQYLLETGRGEELLKKAKEIENANLENFDKQKKDLNESNDKSNLKETQLQKPSKDSYSKDKLNFSKNLMHDSYLETGDIKKIKMSEYGGQYSENRSVLIKKHQKHASTLISEIGQGGQVGTSFGNFGVKGIDLQGKEKKGSKKQKNETSNNATQFQQSATNQEEVELLDFPRREFNIEYLKGVLLVSQNKEVQRKVTIGSCMDGDDVYVILSIVKDLDKKLKVTELRELLSQYETLYKESLKCLKNLCHEAYLDAPRIVEEDGIEEGLSDSQSLKAKLNSLHLQLKVIVNKIVNLKDILNLQKHFRPPFEPEEIDLPLLLSELVNDFRPLLEEKNARIKLKGFEDVKLIRNSPKRVKQVLFNLLHNAITFIKKDYSVEIFISRHPKIPQLIRFHFTNMMESFQLISSKALSMNMAEILNPAISASFKKKKKPDRKRPTQLQTGLRVSNKLLTIIGPKKNMELKVVDGTLQIRFHVYADASDPPQQNQFHQPNNSAFQQEDIMQDSWILSMEQYQQNHQTSNLERAIFQDKNLEEYFATLEESQWVNK